ncbi:GDP-mannose 4,6-dehydratase [Nocardioides sp. R-C-SC26]|uniref:GDP-mannose 4,6-dehydratase n=1 Tax=Nocardioides sp. R-C-SC26 TaxID=2870414 RepID=UPI001E365FA7|nr:GDP-mannose 4,6-dehydratase [Nocardioides sp. R-C-SC26]
MPAQRALITGVGGQDGTYLAEALLADGVEVHAIDTAPTPIPHLPDDVTVHALDLRDVDAVRTLVLELAPAQLYNLAAISSVARSWDQPDLTSAVNGTAAVALMESAWRCQEKHGDPVSFVQASSAEIFGVTTTTPQSESTALAPVNPYGAAKAYGHLMARVYRGRGLATSSLILYNHESPRRPTGFVTRKITSTVAAIRQGRAESLVLGNLDARRDWGWAPDYVEAMRAAARTETPGDFVVATGVSHSVADFVAAAFRHAGIDDWAAFVRTDPEFVRPADAHELVGDATLARDVLGWRPTVGFDDLVRRMVEHDLAQ